MKVFSKLILSLATLSCLSLSVSAQQFVSNSRASTLALVSNISTLYSNDPVAHTLCLIDGREGGVFQDGEARNRCSHIDFDTYKLGNLTVGIQGGEAGAIVDLGSWRDLRTNQAFPQIRFIEGKVLMVQDPRFGKPEELTAAAQLFQPSKSLASVEALPGHIYLARITDRHNKDFQILVKLLVLTAKPGESVTFRWELL
jgi:hypothetical protein